MKEGNCRFCQEETKSENFFPIKLDEDGELTLNSQKIILKTLQKDCFQICLKHLKENAEMNKTKKRKNEEEIKKLNRQQFSRLLYTNPVCILTSFCEEKTNMMIISWLTPINNTGDFICSMKRTRYSASLVLKQKEFGSFLSF
jgi:hypothetical protein